MSSYRNTMYSPALEAENETLRDRLREIREILRSELSAEDKLEQIKRAAR